MQNEQNTITNVPVLTLDSDAVLETAQSKADLIWHEIQNAYRTKKILTGMLGGIEKTENGSLIAIVYYKDFRTVIPITEMMINRRTVGKKDEVSFVVTHIDEERNVAVGLISQIIRQNL